MTTEEMIKPVENQAEFKPTNFRVWMMLNVPNEPIHIPVKTVDEVIASLLTLVKISNQLEEAVFDNVSGVEYEDANGEWVEFYNQDGEDIEIYWDKFYEAYLDNNLLFFNLNLADIVER